MVLGCVPDDDGQAWRLGALDSAAARAAALRNSVDDAPQAAPGDGQRAREPLHGDIEIDDTWIGGPQAGIKGSRQLKDRRAVPVLVAVEQRDNRSGRIRLVVLPNFTAATMSTIVKENVAAGSTVYTDGLGAFEGLRAAGYRHIALKQPLRSALRKGAASVVPLADRVVGNLQNWLIGTHHGVSRAQLQA
jgi:transposase-like protein